MLTLHCCLHVALPLPRCIAAFTLHCRYYMLYLLATLSIESDSCTTFPVGVTCNGQDFRQVRSSAHMGDYAWWLGRPSAHMGDYAWWLGRPSAHMGDYAWWLGRSSADMGDYAWWLATPTTGRPQLTSSSWRNPCTLGTSSLRTLATLGNVTLMLPLTWHHI
jgi:hypothetical protein